MDIKVVLKRSPITPESGVWIDGEKVPMVKRVEVGQSGEITTVTLTYCLIR